MISMLWSSLLAVFLGVIIFCISWLISKQAMADREKSSPFECGFDPLSSARVPFSLRFFLLAVIFLIFDVEIVLLIPAISFMKSVIDFTSIAGVFLFLVILIVGLFHEWNEGSLDWLA
uniref:NADH dehydrogenase subunit 3 n=1 Tax=Gigantopelta aegis TaxID=1735272 RepID=UPI001EE0CA7D|nr:NADH dehydrogenase subunit 3 [Gigantopelta aegis]UFK31947.1 NADH dehydrogenase subunit 3 [Gigantopelta aegis]UKE79915.1 NADH dehydrogenase subunit 3 [Gigantopelta aegis]